MEAGLSAAAEAITDAHFEVLFRRGRLTKLFPVVRMSVNGPRLVVS